jgi:HAMP domain-containing protein
VIRNLGELRKTAQASQDALAVIANYAAPVGDMITLNDLIAQGTSDASLANDVRTLNALSLAKDEAAQQRALFFHAFNQQFFGDGEQQALTTALSEELNDKASFETTATPAEQNSFKTTVAGQGVNVAEGIEDLVLIDGDPHAVKQLGIALSQAPARWYSAMSDEIDKMQAVELGVARNIVARSQVLQRSAEQSALFSAVLTVLILFLVLIATLMVARSLVRPLRRLREGALDIATVQLPERVRQLSEAEDPATSLEVAPIDVLSADEIGQVARAGGRRGAAGDGSVGRRQACRRDHRRAGPRRSHVRRAARARAAGEPPARIRGRRRAPGGRRRQPSGGQSRGPGAGRLAATAIA